MSEQHTSDRLLRWGEALKKEGNGLGDSLIEYGLAWSADYERLQIKVECLRAALLEARDAIRWLCGEDIMAAKVRGDKAIEALGNLTAAEAAGGEHGNPN